MLFIINLLCVVQECAVAQNELLKEFLERIQSRKHEVRLIIPLQCCGHHAISSCRWSVVVVLSYLVDLPAVLPATAVQVECRRCPFIPG